MKLPRLVAKIAIALGLLSACSGTKGTEELSRADLGAQWPFMVESGTLRCELGSVTFTTGAKTYALNGTARGERAKRGWLEAEAILADDPALVKIGDGGYTKMSTQPLIERGLALC
jgi:hypothetical protein